MYIDGYNLYYGARKLCGRGAPGWRWLDVRGLAEHLVAKQEAWHAAGAQVERVVYCTARIDAVSNPSGSADQDVYLKALIAARSVDHIEYGSYVSNVKQAPLAVKDPTTHRPIVHRPQWPLVVQDGNRAPLPDALFMVSYLHQEEKGSDVNVASHLLIDVLTHQVDAVVVVSNDSDLKYPIRHARKHVPVGLVKPGAGRHAGALAGNKTDGVGNHWWTRLTDTEVRDHQLPDPAGKYRKPAGW